MTISATSGVAVETTAEPAAATDTHISPAPLAFGAFAGTTFLLSWVNAGLVAEPALQVAVATAWVFGGLVQVGVGFWHFRNNELFPAVTFGSFGAFWLSFALFATLYLGHIPEDLHGTATALFLTPWAIFSLYMLVGAFRTNRVVVLAFVLVEATLIPLIYGNAASDIAAIRIGGWCGIALALVVWYIAAAEILNHQFGRTLLPLGDLASVATTP